MKCFVIHSLKKSDKKYPLHVSLVLILFQKQKIKLKGLGKSFFCLMSNLRFSLVKICYLKEKKWYFWHFYWNTLDWNIKLCVLCHTLVNFIFQNKNCCFFWSQSQTWKFLSINFTHDCSLIQVLLFSFGLGFLSLTEIQIPKAFLSFF